MRRFMLTETLPAQVALDLVVAVDGLADLDDFLVGKLIHPASILDADAIDDFPRLGLADAVDVLQRDDDALVGGNVDACDTGQAAFLLLEFRRRIKKNALTELALNGSARANGNRREKPRPPYRLAGQGSTRRSRFFRGRVLL